MIIETKRLILREMLQTDFTSLCKILQDEDVMYAYEGAFNNAEVQEWLDKKIENYKEYGFGLWAVVLKGHHGYASEAAAACKDYAFDKLNAEEDKFVKHYRGN